MTALATEGRLQPDVSDLPVQVITGNACVDCKGRFRAQEQVVPVPYAERGLRAARRHAVCGNVTSGGAR